MKDEFTLNDVPGDVQWVWAIEMAGQPVGLETAKKINEIIKNNPKWFPWETKYNEIPDDVHEAYMNECYPDRMKSWELIATNSDIEPVGIKGLMEQSTSDYHGELTQKYIEDFFNQMDEISRKKFEEEAKEEARKKKIWKKHYGKYNLPYPKRYSFEL